MKKILVYIQFVLTFACVVLCILYFVGNNKNYLDILEVTAGIDLILMGIVSQLVHKKIKLTLLYAIVGVIMIMTVVLSKVGVF